MSLFNEAGVFTSAFRLQFATRFLRDVDSIKYLQIILDWRELFFISSHKILTFAMAGIGIP